MATSEHLERLEQANFSQIAPFVNAVTFVAPPNSWTLTYDGFKDVVVAQAVQKYAHDHLNTWHSYWDDGPQAFIEKHWSGKFPLSDEQIRGGFDRYHHDALVVKDLLQGEDLRVAWTKALRALPSGPRLRFVTSAYDDDSWSSQHLPVQPDCIIRPHQHDRTHREETCEKATAPIGDALFAAAIACIAKAGVEARALDVECAMTGEFQWEALPGWATCDFSRVQSFKFQPRVQEIPGNPSRWGRVETLITERAADATAAVLKKCSDSIEEFHYEAYSCPMRWPGHEVIPLTKLRKLSFTGSYIRAGNLKTWMAKMPSLEHFECVSTETTYDEEAGGGTWLDVFDAIRNHPRGMKVEFDDIVANHQEISLSYHTDDIQEYLEKEPAAGDSFDACLSLPLYLSGKIDTDRVEIDIYREITHAW